MSRFGSVASVTAGTLALLVGVTVLTAPTAAAAPSPPAWISTVSAGTENTFGNEVVVDSMSGVVYSQAYTYEGYLVGPPPRPTEHACGRPRSGGTKSASLTAALPSMRRTARSTWPVI